MCGITVSLNYMPTQKEKNKIKKTLRHRGPDDWGEWSSATRNIWIGFNRLAMVDFNSGAQPFEARSNDGKKIILAFNGEITNQSYLRRLIVEGGEYLKTYSDTELIAKIYFIYGKKGFSKLDGFFSFILVDHNDAFIVRDYFGIKPLYQMRVGERVYFSSEQKGILQFNVKPQIDVTSMIERSMLGYTVTGSYLQSLSLVDRNSVAHYSYQGDKWKVKSNTIMDDVSIAGRNLNHISSDQFFEEFQSIVNEYTMSDHWPWILLSGGVDSTLLANAVKYSVGRKFSTILYSENSSSSKQERLQAIATSERLGVNLLEVSINFEERCSSLSDQVWATESPTTSLTYFLAQALHSKKARLALCGEGSDELFLGYPYHQVPARYAGGLDRVLRLGRKVYGEDAERVWAYYNQNIYSSDSLQTAINWDQEFYLQRRHLNLLDLNGMHFSVEIRPPYLSKRIFKLSNAYRLAGKNNKIRKGLIFDAADNYIPKASLNQKTYIRKKLGMPSNELGFARKFEAHCRSIMPKSLLKKHPYGEYMNSYSELYHVDCFLRHYVEGSGGFDSQFGLEVYKTLKSMKSIMPWY